MGREGCVHICTFVKMGRKKVRSYLGHVKLEMPIRHPREEISESKFDKEGSKRAREGESKKMAAQ